MEWKAISFYIRSLHWITNIWWIMSDESQDKTGLSYTGNWRYISFSCIFLFPIFLFLRKKLLIFLSVTYATFPEKNILRAKIFFPKSWATDCRLINCHEPISYLHTIAHILMKNKRWFIKDTTNIDCHTFFIIAAQKKTQFKIVKWMQSK